MTIKDLRDPHDLGWGYEGREYKYPNHDSGLGLMAVDWEERIDIPRMRRERLEKAKKALADSGADALFLFRLENVKYISGYRVHDWPVIFFGLVSALMVPGEDPYIFTMDLDHADLRMPWLKGHVFEQTGGGLETHDGVQTWVRQVKELLTQHGISKPAKIAVDSWNMAIMETLPEMFPGTKFTDGQDLILEARKCKTVDEVNMLKLAYSVTSAGFARALDYLRPGVKECEVLAEAWREFTHLGSEWTQCANIVCSGPYTAPYRRFTSDRIIEYGDMVVIDIGARVNGYYGDFTRTWICGKEAKPTKEQVKIHYTAWEAMRKAEEAIKPGALTTDVYNAAGPSILGGLLGHGLGLASIEPPYIVREDMVPRGKAYVLEPGMVFSIEPYQGEPGIGGVRLEDNIVVTENGFDVISRFPFDNRLLQI